MEETVEVGQVWKESSNYIYCIEKKVSEDYFAYINLILNYRVGLYSSVIIEYCKQIKYYNSPRWKAVNNV